MDRACPARKLSIAFVLLIVLAASPGNWVSVRSTSRQLPADLLITGKVYQDSPPTIFLVDADTLELRPLYTHETATQLKVESVSPQGDYAAVLHVLPDVVDDYAVGYRTQLCFITISGGLQSCFQENLPAYYDHSPMLLDKQFTVTWSPGGDSIHFVIEDIEQGTRSLVEGDPTTGEIIRTIYETKRLDNKGLPSIIAWSPDLTTIADGAMLYDRTGILLNLNTSEEHDLSEVIVPLTNYGLGRSEWPDRIGYVCDVFSPLGTYLTAVDQSDNSIIVFDMDMQIVDIIDDFSDDELSDYRSSERIDHCPVWSMDENILYFIVYIHDGNGYTPNFVAYSLEEQQVIGQYNAPISPIWAPAYTPDRTTIAVTERVFVQVDSEYVGSYAVKVWSLGGETYEIGSRMFSTDHPVWLPTGD